MNNKLLLTFIGIAYCFSPFFAQQSKIHWQPTMLQMDGNPNDWTTSLRFLDAESNIKFDLRTTIEELVHLINYEQWHEEQK